MTYQHNIQHDLAGGSSASFDRAATARSDHRTATNDNDSEADIALAMLGQTPGHRPDQFMSKLLAMVAHDLRNPLSAVMFRAELIETAIATKLGGREKFDDRAIVDDVAKSVSAIIRASERMDRMITDLLEAARKRAKGFDLRRVEHDVSETVLATVWDYEAQAQSKQIEITTGLERPVIVYADLARLSDAIGNLISNAIKYSYQGQRISVTSRLTTDRDCAEIVVSDQGQGMSAEDLALVFKPFLTLSAKPTGGEASIGLGLANVRSIVEAHGGSVTVHSEGCDMGTSVHLWIPVRVLPA